MSDDDGSHDRENQKRPNRVPNSTKGQGRDGLTPRPPQAGAGEDQPIFNIPSAVAGTIAVLVVMHMVREYFLSNVQDENLIVLLSFIPLRYTAVAGDIPGGMGPAFWGFFTHVLLHGDWMHLGFNALWLLAFGTPVYRRVGFRSFFVLGMLGAACGALLFALANWGEIVFLIGASGAISAYFGAASRFVFEPPLLVRVRKNEHDTSEGTVIEIPGASNTLRQFWANRRARGFAVSWFVINLIFGLSTFSFGGAALNIAWEAHIGGFVAGFLLMPLLDPMPRVLPEKMSD